MTQAWDQKSIWTNEIIPWNLTLSGRNENNNNTNNKSQKQNKQTNKQKPPMISYENVKYVGKTFLKANTFRSF